MMMDRGQWANLARMPRLNSYSFLKNILGFFWDNRESGVQFNIIIRRTGWMDVMNGWMNEWMAIKVIKFVTIFIP